MVRTWILILLVAGCGGASSGVPSNVSRKAGPGLEATPVATEAGAANPGLGATPLADEYRDEAATIIEAALADDGAWAKLEYLTDRIGARLAGSKNLERAVEWALAAMKADGHANVRAEKVMVPHWVRGEERAALVAPDRRELFVLGLGGTVATPRRGVTAEVVVVSSFEQLAELGKAGVEGKIVLYDKKMPAYDPEQGAGYGETVVFRSRGPAEAAKLGAVAAMVRSVTATSLRSPHTGATNYEDGVDKIPAVAVSTEDADLIARLAAAGETVKVELVTSGTWHPDAESANVIAELPGREKPEQVVVIGAHLDSWDVGQGAHDDGTGCAIMMQALTVLKNAGLQPRRTIRVVLFTNEENGLRGAFGYAAAHADEIPSHVAGIESDSGGFAPRGFDLQGGDQALAQAADIATLLEPLGASRVRKGFGGADLIPLARAGVPAIGLWVDERTYFDIHHTHADTLDKVDPDDLKKNVAAVAVLAYVLADMPDSYAAADREATPAQ